MTDSTKFIGSTGLTWKVPVLKVAFNGADPTIYPLIAAAASEWTSQGGRLSFSFNNPDGSWRTWSEADINPAADIRIGFFTDPQRDGYWSAVGTLSKRFAANEATMNFGDLGTRLLRFRNGQSAAQWQQSYSHSVVLHEFGHALGLSHEHFHPECQADLKLDAAVAYLMGPPNNWTRENAMYNMDAATYLQAMRSQPGGVPTKLSPHIDQASVMLYSFADTIYKSGIHSPCRPSGPQHYATTLSALDRQYYADEYAH